MISSRLSQRLPKWALGMVVCLVLVASATVAVALSCVGDDMETLTLELERVEVDGEVQSDTAAYEGMQVEVNAMYEGRLDFRAKAEQGLWVRESFLSMEAQND